ncbi:hypothetical protein AMAG_15706 [Allomyces macrogynus ATCC 38327]|uniref:Kinesin motor domain-containing protein n=1 Tax=Allomyces macrogynus (strain ATCC 38327) TaxID=578462 RepID=A0A0L0T9N2_ALLM3|nr:hypothetical protein AMAG_15706 [Allomyces macrogynus ATCC 38327]|eukprot:KNE71483.1 hypothetical protein AMAG_15706 [Allomyces macrogynus ATCC 38327]
MLTAATTTASPTKPSTASNSHAPGRRECPVTVAVRIRPPLGSDPLSRSAQASAVTQVEDRNQVAVHQLDGDAPRAFTFDHVFGPTATQDEVYDMCARQLLDPVAQGFNATVLRTANGDRQDVYDGHVPTGGLEHEISGMRRGDESTVDMLPDVNQRLVASKCATCCTPAHDGPEVVIREDRHGNITMQGVSQVPPPPPPPGADRRATTLARTRSAPAVRALAAATASATVPEFDAHEAEWRYRKLEAQLFESAAANEKLQVQVTDLRSQVDAKSRALAHVQSRVKEAEELVQYYQVRADEAEMRVKRRENEVEQYQAELEEGAGELEAAAREIARLKGEVRGLRVAAVVMVEKVEVGTMVEEGDVPANEAAAGVAAELVGIEQEMERKLQMIQELDQSRQRTDNLSKKFQDKMTRLERELHTTEKLVEKLKSEKLDMDSEKNKLRHDYETKIRDITAQLHALRSRQKQHDKLLKEKEANGRQIQELQSEVATLRDKEAALKRKAKSDTDKLASAEHIYTKEIAQLQRQHDDDLRKIKILEAQVHSLRKRSGGATASPSRASSSAPSVVAAVAPAPPPPAPPVAEIEELKTAFERQIEQLRRERDQQAAQVQELEHYRINNKELRLKMRELMRSAKNGANGIAVMDHGAATTDMDTALAVARHTGTSTPAMTSV